MGRSNGMGSEMSGEYIDRYASAIIDKLHQEVIFIESMTCAKPKELILTQSDFDVLRSYNQFSLACATKDGEFNRVLGIKIRIVK